MIQWKIPSFTNRSIIHTVDLIGNSYRCSCKDFRINHNPNCKHIRLVARQNDYVSASVLMEE